MERYETITGSTRRSGAFSTIWRCRDSLTGLDNVALKRVRLCSGREGEAHSDREEAAARELGALRRLRHPNVVELLGAFAHEGALHLAFEWHPTDLRCTLGRAEAPLSRGAVRRLAAQLLAGVAHVHARGILHRDLKPANLLLSADGALRVADFGLARPCLPSSAAPEAAPRAYTHTVATRWYRAPELLWGARDYGPAVDVWAVGCILVELMNHAPLFPGGSDIGQIAKVIATLGSPSAERWPGLLQLPDYGKMEFDFVAPVDMRCILGDDASDAAVDLAGKLLSYNPADRPTAAEALQHAYFELPPGDCAAQTDRELQALCK